MKKDNNICDWVQKIRNALKVNSNVICVFHNQENSHFLVLYSPKMDDTTKQYVENLESQMDKVIRISNSLNKKINSATSNSIDKPEQSDQEGKDTKKAKDTRDLKIKNIVSQNEDLRHIAQTLTLELERSRNTEKNLRAENSKLLQEKDRISLEISSFQAREIIIENSLQEAKQNLEKLRTENEMLKKELNSYGQERDVSINIATKESRSKNEELEEKISALKDNYETRISTLQNEIENFKSTLFSKEIEFREKLQLKEKEVEEKFTKQLDALKNENRKLLHDKEALILQENSLQIEGRILGRDLQQAKANLEKAKEENEFLKYEFSSPHQRGDQVFNLKIEEQEIAKRFEEVKSSYDDRIRVLQQDFESRRLTMVAEIQRLRTALTDKENELRCKYEANERQSKDKYKNEIELITKQYRSLLEEKGKLTFEMCNMKSQERSFEEANDEKYVDIKTQNEFLRNELNACRQQLEQNISSNQEVQDLIMKLQEMKSSYENLIRNLQRDFESRDLITKREIELLRNTLSDKDLEVHDKIQRKEKEIHQRFSKRLETLTEDNLSLMQEKDKCQIEIEALKNQEASLLRNLHETEINMEKIQIENESLKRDLGTKQRYMDEIVRLNVEKHDKIKELEETRSSYDARISSILGDFEARRLVMVNEIEKLRAAVEDKEKEVLQKIEKDKHEKGRSEKYIESLNAELRKQLQEKEKVISEMGSLRSQEKILSQSLKEAEQTIEKLNADRDAMKRELIVIRQQTQQMVSIKYEEDETRKRFEKMRSTYEERIQALQNDFETRRLVMVNEMEKLRKLLANKDDEIRLQLDEKEREVKENYEKLVECLSNELKRTLSDAKQNEDLIHEKWNAKLVDCREQMRRNMMCLERQIEISTNNATMRNNQLANERDELKSKILILENELERKRRQFEIDILERDKKMDGVMHEQQRAMQEMENLKECIIHKDNMIDVLQETVRKECTEREDILRKLDEIRKSSKSTIVAEYSRQVGNTPDASPIEKACVQYVPPSGSDSPRGLSPELFGIPVSKSSRPIPAYMKGIPLMLPPSCLSASKGGTPVRCPSTPKLVCKDSDSSPSDIAKLCVVGRAAPELEFTIARGKSKKPGKLIRSKSLQTPNSHEAAHHYEKDRTAHA